MADGSDKRGHDEGLVRLAAIIDAHEDWWRFPEENPVQGFLGSDHIFIVGDQPSTSAWPPTHPSRRVFYDVLGELGIGGAHLTDLYKKRGPSGALRKGLPADFCGHVAFFRQEMALLQPTKVIALGDLAHELIGKHVPEIRHMLGHVWHFAYAARPDKKNEWKRQLRAQLGLVEREPTTEHETRVSPRHNLHLPRRVPVLLAIALNAKGGCLSCRIPIPHRTTVT